MSKTLLLLLSLALCAAGAAQTPRKGARGGKRPAAGAEVPGAPYVPKDLEDSFEVLKRTLAAERLAEMKAKSDGRMVEYHFGLGMWMRNEWGLWRGSRLSRWFNALGVFHPEDMSSIILSSFRRHLRGEPLGVEEQVSARREWWRKMAAVVEEDKPLPAGVLDAALRTHDGKELRLSEFAGRVVILAILDADDVRSPQLVPHLAALKRAHAADGLEVVGVLSVGGGSVREVGAGGGAASPGGSTPADGAGALKRMARRFKPDYPLCVVGQSFVDELRRALDFHVVVIPQTFIISRDGRVLQRLNGFDAKRTPPRLRALAESALSRPRV